MHLQGEQLKGWGHNHPILTFQVISMYSGCFERLAEFSLFRETKGFFAKRANVFLHTCMLFLENEEEISEKNARRCLSSKLKTTCKKLAESEQI